MLREDRVAGGADRHVAVGGVAQLAHDEAVVAHVEPGAVHREAAPAARDAVAAHHRRKRLHAAQRDVGGPRAEIERAGIDDLHVLHDRAIGSRGDVQRETARVFRLVEAEDVGERVEEHPAPVHERSGRLHDKPRVEDRARCDVNLAHGRLHDDHAVLAGRIEPAIDIQDAGIAIRGNLCRILRRVGEDGENRLVGVVESDAEHRWLLDQDRNHAVAKPVPEAPARGKDGIRAHVLGRLDVQAHGRAVEGEFAEAAVHVAAAGALDERRLFAVVVNGNFSRRIPLLRDGHAVGVVALDPLGILRIDDEFRPRARRRGRRERRGGDGKAANAANHWCNMSSAESCAHSTFHFSF